MNAKRKVSTKLLESTNHGESRKIKVDAKFDNELQDYVPIDRALTSHYFWWKFYNSIKIDPTDEDSLTDFDIDGLKGKSFADWISHLREDLISYSFDRATGTMLDTLLCELVGPGRSKKDAQAYIKNISRTSNNNDKFDIYIRVSTIYPKDDLLKAISKIIDPHVRKTTPPNDLKDAELKITQKSNFNQLKRTYLAWKISQDNPSIKGNDLYKKIAIDLKIKTHESKGDIAEQDERLIQNGERIFKRAKKIIDAVNANCFPSIPSKKSIKTKK